MAGREKSNRKVRESRSDFIVRFGVVITVCISEFDAVVPLFPFNGCRWFGADIVNNTVHTTNFVDDAIADFG